MHAALLATLLPLSAHAATADKEEPAPRVQGLTVAHGPMTLSELKGEVVILQFWATWCAPCLTDLDSFAAEDAALRAEGIRFVGVNVDETHELEAVERLAQSRGWDFPILLDPRRRALAAYHSKRSVPVTAIIDEKGVLKELHLSWDEGDVSQALEEARELRAASTGTPKGEPKAPEEDDEEAEEKADD